MKRTDWIKRASGLFVPPMLRWSPGYPCGCVSGDPCEACSGGVAPSLLSVAVSGFTGDAAVLNDDYILDFHFSSSGECGWRYVFSEGVSCGGTYDVWRLDAWVKYASGSSRVDVGFVIGTDSPGVFQSWYNEGDSVVGQLDCLHLDYTSDTANNDNVFSGFCSNWAAQSGYQYHIVA